MKTPPKRRRSLPRAKVFRKFLPGDKGLNKSFKSNKKYVESLKENNAAMVSTVAALRRQIAQLRNDSRHNYTQYNNLSMDTQMCKDRIAQVHRLIRETFAHLSEISTVLMTALEETGSVLTILTPQQEQLHPSPSFQEQQPSPSFQEQQPSPSHPGMLSKSSSPGLCGNHVNSEMPSPGAACDIASPTLQGAACDIASPSRQCAAKPMVQGHTISKPTISLQRVNLPLRQDAGLVVQDEGMRGRLSDVFEESGEAVDTSQLPPTPHERVDENYDCINEREELECESGNNECDSDSSSEAEAMQSTKSALNVSGDGLTSLPQVVLERLHVSSAINVPLTEEDRSPIDLPDDSTEVIFGSYHPVEAGISALDGQRSSANVQLNSLPTSSWVDDWVDESSSEDESNSLALQIAESRKSYLEPARQVHLKEGTSWNYDDKGNYHSKPTKKRGRKPKAIKRKSSNFTKQSRKVMEDGNATLVFEDHDMSLTQPITGMVYVENVNDEQSSVENRPLLESPPKKAKKRKESLVHSQPQVSLARLADNTESRQPSDRMMYVTQRGSRERAANYSQYESDGKMYNHQESYSLSKKSLNSSALINSPLKTPKLSLESSFEKSHSRTHRNSSPSCRMQSKKTSVAMPLQLTSSSSKKSLSDSPIGKRNAVHVLSTSPFRSWVLLERLPSETKRRLEDAAVVPRSSRSSNEDRTVHLQRRSLSSPRKSSSSRSAIPTYSPTNLKSPISTKWKGRDLKVLFSPKCNGGSGGGCGGDDDDDDDDKDEEDDKDSNKDDNMKEDDNLSLKTSKRKHKSIKTRKQSSKVRIQSKQRSRKSNSLHLPSPSGVTPTTHVSDLTEQNLRSLSSNVSAFTVSDSDLSSTSSDFGGMRPRRLKAPKNLKEPSLNKKMRR